MTDEELIKELRERPYRMGSESNDEAKLRRQAEREAAADRIEALKYKLDKAVSALREIKSVECIHCTDLFNELADDVLNDTEGEKK
jgi:hypothetical protein